METLISQLLDLPDQVHRGDFVLNLSEGVTSARPSGRCATTSSPPQLADAFDNALGFIQSALDGRNSKAAYLHGSFGCGQEPLHGRAPPAPAARRPGPGPRGPGAGLRQARLGPGQAVPARALPHDRRPDMESAILGGYADHVRRLHPEAPWPGVYLAEDLFEDARRYRANWATRSSSPCSARAAATRSGASGPQAWTPEKFEAAMAAPPGDDRAAGSSATWSSTCSTATRASRRGETEAFLSLDKGLSVISRHARTSATTP